MNLGRFEVLQQEMGIAKSEVNQGVAVLTQDIFCRGEALFATLSRSLLCCLANIRKSSD